MFGDISELALCTRCFQLSGYYGEGGAKPHLTPELREHRCHCQPHDDEWKKTWDDAECHFDIRALVDICSLCLRGLMSSGSRFSWLACHSCRQVDNQIGNALAGEDSVHNRLLSLGRHTIMNGSMVFTAGKSVAQITSELIAAMGPPRGFWLNAFAWRHREGERLVEARGGEFDGMSKIPLEKWFGAYPASPGASADAICRFTGEDRLLDIPVLAELRAARLEFLRE